MRWRAGAAALIVFAGCRLHVKPVPALATDVTFRLVQWNVSENKWTEAPERTRAVLRHIDADIFILNEVSELLGESGVRRMLVGLKGSADTTWYVSFGAGGGFQRTVIASRDTMRSLPEFALVTYPTSGRLVNLAELPDTANVRSRKPDDIQSVGTNAAMVRMSGRWLVVAGMDLFCCGTPGSWREYRRQLEASAIRDRLRSAVLRWVPHALIAAGDMNLVAGRAALDTILNTLSGSPLGPMVRADAVHFDGWTDWTWDGRGTAFNGGRLDNVTYSAGSLNAVRARVWDTEFLPADTLRAYQLTSGTSKSIGQHRPVVVDFRFRH